LEIHLGENMSRFRMRLRRVMAEAVRTNLDRFTETGRARLREERGQTTAEYALVLLGAAGIALLLLGWATQSGAVGTLFDAVVGGVIGKVK
jgi:Flp pilus assembly pilin Flp